MNVSLKCNINNNGLCVFLCTARDDNSAMCILWGQIGEVAFRYICEVAYVLGVHVPLCVFEFTKIHIPKFFSVMVWGKWAYYSPHR